MGKILVAPWGLYDVWKEAEYSIYGDDETGCDRITEKSTTPLKLLKKYIKPDRTIIVTLDTVYFSNKYKGERGHETYSEILDAIKSHTIEYVNTNIGNNAVDNIFVSPGVGEFDRGIAIGQMMDFYYVTLHNMINEVIKLKDDEGNNQKKIEFYLDLTHGVNFMPTLMYKIIHEIARLTALTNEAKVVVFNSEPFPYQIVRGKNNEQIIPKLRVHKLEEKKITKAMALGMVSESGAITKNDYFAFESFVENDEKGDIRKIASEASRMLDISPTNITTFLGGLEFGLPLVIYSYYPPVENVDEFRRRLYEFYKNNTEVENKNDLLYIKHKILFTENFRTLQYVYLISKVINLAKKEEIAVEDIIYLRDSVFREQQPVEISINREIRELKNGFVKVCCANVDWSNSWVPYDKIFSFNESHSERYKENEDIQNCITNNMEIITDAYRNFFAHMGLSRTHLEVKFKIDYNKKDTLADECGRQKNEQNRIFLRYPHSKIKEIQRFILKAKNLVPKKETKK